MTMSGLSPELLTGSYSAPAVELVYRSARMFGTIPDDAPASPPGSRFVLPPQKMIDTGCGQALVIQSCSRPRQASQRPAVCLYPLPLILFRKG